MIKLSLLSVLIILWYGNGQGLAGSLGENITTIYLVSSCHLDVGFADTSANIVNEYFDRHFPKAIRIAQELREIGTEERLVFTTHSFLVYLYYNCLPELGLHCPNESQRLEFTNAIKQGDITWHAFPFNSQMEFYDVSLADFGFKLSHKLDAQFGKKPSITMSQRDVPGTTRSIIPILAANGVEAITVGVNYAAMPPAVPTVFVWRDPISQTDVIGMWHPHGYGGDHGPNLQSMVIVPGLQSALAFAIRGDNSGPPSILGITRNYVELSTMFPNAKIIASGYDVFVNELLTVKQQLPVYTEEIGDTWIYGVASDPAKTAKNRAIMRLRSTCIASGACSLDDDRFFAFSTLLLKNGEHTWGKDVKKFLHDVDAWTNKDFQANVKASNFQDMVNSWVEQRFWGVEYATKLLGDHPLQGLGINEVQWGRIDNRLRRARH